jgi:hypothetical protein
MNDVNEKSIHESVGEEYDGRLLFHSRRNNIHVSLIILSKKAFVDNSYMEEFCTELINLHILLYGSVEGLKRTESITLKNGQKYFPSFNEYMTLKLRKILLIILENTQVNERADGKISKLVNREAIKHLWFDLDIARREFALIEYQKNLDLPRKIGMFEKAKQR